VIVDREKLLREYEEMLATMATPGYAMIIEDFERLRADHSNVRNCTNLDMAKGRVDILDLLANWKKSVENAYESLKNEKTESEDEGS
jgi:hypothetical protein